VDRGGRAEQATRSAGSHLPWTENPDDRRDRFLQGRCDCGDDLGGARYLGIVDAEGVSRQSLCWAGPQVRK
jgi:hypothetical protein